MVIFCQLGSCSFGGLIAQIFFLSVVGGRGRKKKGELRKQNQMLEITKAIPNSLGFTARNYASGQF